MELSFLVFAFIGGVMGAIVGSTPAFIIYGLTGIISLIIRSPVNNSFYNIYILNTLFAPYVCFAGAVAGVAYAANRRHYNLSGMNGTKSLWFTNDLSVYMVSGAFGVLGCFISLFLQKLNIPVDTGALSIVICAILVRKLISNSQIISCDTTYICYISSHLKKNLPNEIIPPFILSLITGIIVKETGNFNICFWMSALSLIFIQFDSSFPATHHITLISGYAVSNSGSIGIGILFGILAQLLFECVNVFINYGQFYVEVGDESNFKSRNRSHFDPPATTIAILSFIIFLFLKK